MQQLGLVTLVTVAAVSTYAMLLVVRCKYRLKAQGKEVSTYGEIGHVAMGRLGSTLVNSCLVISQTGFCVACKPAILPLLPELRVAHLIVLQT